jgi:hypothetical protein
MVEDAEDTYRRHGAGRQRLSRRQVVYPATPDSTAVVKEFSTSDILLLLETVL